MFGQIGKALRGLNGHRADAAIDRPSTAGKNWDEEVEFGGIYRVAARQSLATRNPVIVIPGIMGSRLVVKPERRSIWGDFANDHAKPALAEDAQLIALPMAEGQPLDRLVGQGYTDGSLANCHCKFAGIPLRRRVYGNVLAAMGVSGYMGAGGGGEVTETSGHAAAFEFDYDWRRSLDESAIRFQRSRGRGHDPHVVACRVSPKCWRLTCAHFDRPEDSSSIHQLTCNEWAP